MFSLNIWKPTIVERRLSLGYEESPGRVDAPKVYMRSDFCIKKGTITHRSK